MIRIAIADDHPMFREGLRNALSVAADLQVVGEAADGQAALELCARERPDVLMLDLTMPRCDGFGVLEQLHRTTPTTRALVLTMHIERRFEERSLTAGASGFLRKDSPVSMILRAVRAIASGETVWASRRSAFQVLSRPATPTPVEPLSVLTSREREILVLLGRGRRNREIAEETGLSEKTVATHVASILGKLGLRSRVEAALLASRRAADLEGSAGEGKR